MTVMAHPELAFGSLIPSINAADLTVGVIVGECFGNGCRYRVTAVSFGEVFRGGSFMIMVKLDNSE